MTAGQADDSGNSRQLHHDARRPAILPVYLANAAFSRHRDQILVAQLSRNRRRQHGGDHDRQHKQQKQH
ncbi:hypothetical protein Pla8534_05300 [Lignipirellula cremea]|uniref:Uncharacterized protein n=1 Tax=Lignipirellula cremea TaxID=2528010 RepID=A0A518DLT6_9BACT|nr:hypothetical protein Pla8534_05300 [Lignipirellula cremea]